MKTLFITIADWYGVRNILTTEAFKILKSTKDLKIVIFSPFHENRSIIADLPQVQGENVFFEDLMIYRPNIVEKLLRKLQEIIIFNINYVETIKIRELVMKKRNYFKYLLFKALKKILGKNKNLIKAFENLDILLSKHKHKKYRKPFEKYKPNLLFSTNFLQHTDWGMVKTARLCGVPVISMIANWDHLTKGILPKSEKVIGWNEFNRKELIRYYGYHHEDILVAGIPHQDYFVSTKDRFLSKKEFLKSIGVSEDKKLITYTTARGASFEPELVEIICEAIKSGKIRYPVHLHVRVHPEDDYKRYQKLEEKYKHIITFEGGGKTLPQKFWSASGMMAVTPDGKMWLPETEDMIHYANLLSASDVVVNIASSVTLDSVALDIPTINIAFDGYTQRDFVGSSIRQFMSTHYKFIPESGGVKVAKNAEELVEFINIYLDSPQLDRDGRKKIVAEHGGKLDGECGERIARFILDFLEKC